MTNPDKSCQPRSKRLSQCANLCQRSAWGTTSEFPWLGLDLWRQASPCSRLVFLNGVPPSATDCHFSRSWVGEGSVDRLHPEDEVKCHDKP
jgi:hypothetical protein